MRQNRSFWYSIDMPISNIFVILSYKYPLERDTHASLLVELGFTPLEIAERLGHEKIETTLNTYSHLYPNKQAQLADRLNGEFTKEGREL